MSVSINMSHSLKDRDLSFDAFRGFAIIAVVAIHAIPWPWYRDYTVLSYRQLLNFAVPAFLFISGYWMSKKPIGSLKDYQIFLRRRFSRILVPYLFWSTVYLGYETIKVHDYNVTQLLCSFLTGEASIQFYFIIILTQLYILTPFLNDLNRKPYGFISVLIFNLIVLIILYFLRLYSPTFENDFHNFFHELAFSWIIFYQIGLLIGNKDNKMFDSRSIPPIILITVLSFLVISEWEAITISSHFNNWLMAICALKLSSFMYSVCIISGFLILRERLKTWPRVLVLLGNYSFGIFLIHMIILRGIAKVLHKIDAIYSFQVLYGFIVVFTTLVICCFLIAITRKLLPKSFYSKILGF